MQLCDELFPLVGSRQFLRGDFYAPRLRSTQFASCQPVSAPDTWRSGAPLSEICHVAAICWKIFLDHTDVLPIQIAENCLWEPLFSRCGYNLDFLIFTADKQSIQTSPTSAEFSA